MEIFLLDEEVAQLAADLPTHPGVARLQALVTLAWHLRQRATPRARALVAEAESLLAQVELPPRENRAVCARLQLIRAEANWLFADLERAAAQVLDALQQFTALDDLAGCADAHWLQAAIALAHGNALQVDTELERMAEFGRALGDALRTDTAEAALAMWTALRDRRLGLSRWGQRFSNDMADLHPAVATWVNNFRGIIATEARDFEHAAAYRMQSQQAALGTGQLWLAILAATNIGASFTTLNDHHAALDWMQRALELARPTGWPYCIGLCLTQSAETLRHLKRPDAAQELLNEALAVLAPLSGSRTYTLALQYLADLALDRGEHEEALAAFRRLRQRADGIRQFNFQIESRRGEAHALACLGRPHEALQVAGEALAMAREQSDPYSQIMALRVLAEIHGRHALPPPPGMTEPSAALHYLQLALTIAHGLDSYTIPGDLLDAMARAYHQLGDYPQAYHTSMQAIAAREKTLSLETTNRAIALQVRHQTERAQAEGEYHRQMAVSEAKRAELLQQTSATLELLSVVGQEITAHLDAAAVFQALNRHVHRLLDATYFTIYLNEPDAHSLSSAFRVEAGISAMHGSRVPLSDNSAYCVQCLHEQREILIDIAPGEQHPNHIEDTMPILSALFAPLSIAGRALGVISVQAAQRHAYRERERMIFRTLCAYGAIAIDNANAYRQLKQAQAQLVAQEKLAALGSLVAGVAHELNTPIGNSLMIASALQEKTDGIDAKMRQRSLRHSDLLAYIDDAKEAGMLIMRGLTSAADLVNSFKQVAVDRTTAQRRVFNLAQTSHEVVATMSNQIRGGGHAIALDIPETIAINSYPGPYGQVIANFINNALLHGFEGRAHGKMWLTARQDDPARVLIEFGDDGAGIPEQHLKRIFDPFFTTKMGQGGSGLGLNICYNIVTSLLQGKLTVASRPGAGTAFTLDLPLAVPEPRR